MLDYAQRLQSHQKISLSESLERQQQCYLAALNVFRLLGKDHAWTETSAGFSYAPPASPKRKRETESSYSLATIPGARRVVLTLRDLEKRYALAKAHGILLASGKVSSTVQVLSEEDTLTLLSKYDHFDLAITLAKLCPPDLKLAGLRGVFSKITRNCLEVHALGSVTTQEYVKF